MTSKLIFSPSTFLTISNKYLHEIKVAPYSTSEIIFSSPFIVGINVWMVISLLLPIINNPSTVKVNFKFIITGMGDLEPMALLATLSPFKNSSRLIVNFIYCSP